MRLRLRTTLAAIVLTSCGFAVASALGSPSRGGQTVTLSVPQPTVVTVTVAPVASDSGIEEARSDPARVAGVRDARLRHALLSELRDLDLFLATRPKLQPYRNHLWFVAHHSPWHLRARQVAAVLWCAVWFPQDCGAR